MSEYMDYNQWLDIEVKRLKEENKQLKKQNNEFKKELFNSYLLHEYQKELISELKIALSSYNNFVDEMFPD